MLYRSIGPAGARVSAISLGSWNTFSRLSPDECGRLLRRAVDRGVNLFDIAFYWDKPDTERMFADAVGHAGILRGQIQIALKLWLWNYPEQTLREQASESLQRLRMADADLVMVSRPTPEVDIDAFCGEIAALVDAGVTRQWGATNWEPAQLARAREVLPPSRWPALVQLQYNVARRAVVESAEYDSLFADGTLKLCAAFVLEGGILAGHLDRDRVNPGEFARGVRPRERNIARDAGGVREQIRALQPALAAIARDFDASAAQLAIAFALAHPALGTALIGVTTTDNLDENLDALKLLASRDQWLPRLESLKVAGVAHPRLFDPVKHE